MYMEGVLNVWFMNWSTSSVIALSIGVLNRLSCSFLLVPSVPWILVYSTMPLFELRVSTVRVTLQLTVNQSVLVLSPCCGQDNCFLFVVECSQFLSQLTERKKSYTEEEAVQIVEKESYLPMDVSSAFVWYCFH
jgi:hypothetical protein